MAKSEASRSVAYADSYCRKENKTMLKEGQMVQVVLPLKDTVGAETVADFKGVVTTVKEVKMYRKGRSTTFYSYTLHGCHLIVQIPAYGLFNAFFKLQTWLPSQLPL